MKHDAPGDFWNIISEESKLPDLIQAAIGPKRPWAVLPVGERKYLFERREKFCAYCAKLRTSKEGEALCLKCDRAAATRIAKSGKPDIYLCHAGLWDIAVPILTPDGTALTALFTGQFRCTNAELDKKGVQMAAKVERRMGFPKDTLMSLREDLEAVTHREMETLVKNTLVPVADYLGTEWQGRDDYHTHLREHDAADQLRKGFETCEDPREYFDCMAGSIGAVCKALDIKKMLLLFPTRPRTPLAMALRASYGIRVAQQGDKRIEFPGTDSVVQLAKEGDVVELDGSHASRLLSLFAKKAANIRVLVAAAGIREQKPILLIASAPKEDWRVGPAKRAIVVLAREYAAGFITCREFANKAAFTRALSHEMMGPARAIQSTGGILADMMADKDAFAPERFLNRFQDLIGIADLVLTRAFAFQTVSNLADAKLGIIARLPVRLQEIESYAGWRTEQVHKDLLSLVIEGVRVHQAILREEENLSEFDVDFDSFLPLEDVVADTALLKHILMNIIDNAGKYGQPGRDIKIYARMDGEVKVIGVQDEGLAFGDTKRAFELYYRGEEAQTVRPSGTGIGLTLANHFCELHGWKLKVAEKAMSNKLVRVSVEIHIGADAVDLD